MSDLKAALNIIETSLLDPKLLAELRRMLTAYHGTPDAMSDSERDMLKARNVELLSENRRLCKDWQQTHDLNKELLAEIAKLRAAAKEPEPKTTPWTKAAMDAIERQAAEVHAETVAKIDALEKAHAATKKSTLRFGPPRAATARRPHRSITAAQWTLCLKDLAPHRIARPARSPPTTCRRGMS